MSAPATGRPSLALLLARLACIALLLGMAVHHQHRLFSNQPHRVELFEQKMRLPDPAWTRVATLGFRQAYADFMFLRAIQAYGAGWLRPGESREPVYDYFDKVSDIDPRFTALYRFGNLIVADSGGDYKRGQRLLKKGLLRNPRDFDIAYIGIYDAIWAMDDEASAKWFIHMLERQKDAPEFLLRMKEYVDRKQGRYEAAFETLLGFYVRYGREGNTFERSLLSNRFRTIVDGWYRRHLAEGIERYFLDTGEYPMDMEQILDPKYTPPALLPLLERAKEAGDALTASDIPAEEAAREAARLSMIRIDGLPPEPTGTWYFLSRTKRTILMNDPKITADDPAEKRFGYIVAVREFLRPMDEHSIVAQNEILKYRRENNDTPPPPEWMAGMLGPDSLGGHFVYDPSGPFFYSTTVKRISEGKEPRMGASGRGPFPLPLRPSFTDYPEDMAWAIEQKLINPDGSPVITPLLEPELGP
jgi:hypothetical protein